MSQPCRLSDGGRIDRAVSLAFTFNGQELTGHPGDSLASALLANGVRVVGRSFKYHRPRGIYTAGEEEPCALLELGDGDRLEVSVRAPTVALEYGLVSRSQSGWPSLGFDVARLADFTHRLWPAGFYNKTFKWPRWNTWEGLVRSATGLGRVPDGPDPDRYEQVHVHCDVLVCGAGPAGLLTALSLARAGLRVIVAEQHWAFGGALGHEQLELDGQPADLWVAEVTRELRGLPDTLLLPDTTVAGLYDHNVTTLLQRGRGSGWRECFWTVRPRRVVLASGAIEQGLIFPENDRPGIMLAGAVRHYLNRQAVAPGRDVVVATNNDSAYQTAFDLAARGIGVSTIVEARAAVCDALAARVAEIGAELLTGSRIAGTDGTRGIRRIRLADVGGRDRGARPCDLLAVSGGWAPRVHLLCQARGSLEFDAHAQCFVPGHLPPGMDVIGAANGTLSLAAVLDEAHHVSQRLLETLGAGTAAAEPPRVTTGIVESAEVRHLPPLDSPRRQWIDLAHDVTLDDAALAVREGFDSVEHFKRYTTTGMSVDQGKTGNLNAFIALGWLTGREPGEIGTTTFRPPYSPVTLGAAAGRTTGEFHAPRRFLPAHVEHVRLGGLFEDYGWQRPDCYPHADENAHEAIDREVLAVRNAVGVFDNSPIGKIEVRGPDAAEFLHRVYMNDLHGLPTGRCRYGLMLNENAVIIDDGVVMRLDQQHFLVNTTSAGASRITAMLEQWLQCEWRGLKVLIDDVTTQWATFTLAGPNARRVLERLEPDFVVSAQALPHMACTSGHLGGLGVRIARVSFSGELSFEISMPASRGCAMLAAVLEVGQELGVAPYGVEALMILRNEKGYIHVGSDTDGTTTPDDVGWGHVARAKRTDFIGRRSLLRAGNMAGDRRQLVGLEALGGGQALRPGGHVLIGRDRRPPAPTDGWITSACFSPTLGKHIALGLVRGGHQRSGEILTVCDGDSRYHVRVVPRVFFDPGNDRLRM